MEKENKLIEQKKEKISEWIKDPHNLIFVGILIFAFIIRWYFFSLTKTQPLWWDEADYMNMANYFGFGTPYNFIPVRPILFSMIIGFILKISNSEVLIRFIMLLFSMASVVGIYYLGKEIVNKKVGLISSLLMSIIWLNLFLTFRILVDIPSLTFFTFSAFFFYKYFKTNSKKALYIGSVIIAIGTLIRLPTATFLFAVVIYVLITERFRFLRKKEYWIAAIIFILVLSPYLIWGYKQFGGFVIAQAGAHNAPEGPFFQNMFANLKSYLSLFSNYFSWLLLIIFVLGLFSMYKIFIGFDVLFRGEDMQLKRDLYLLLIFLIPLIVVSFSLAYIEDRYILIVFPAILIISSKFILELYTLINKKEKFFAWIFLILFLGLVIYLQLQSANSLIKDKQNSYIAVKEAGLWLKQNTEPSAVIATRSRPQIKYYSEGEVFEFPETKEEFEKALLLPSNENVKYYMVSVFEQHNEWIISYPQEKNLTPVQAYFADQERKQPILVIYAMS